MLSAVFSSKLLSEGVKYQSSHYNCECSHSEWWWIRKLIWSATPGWARACLAIVPAVCRRMLSSQMTSADTWADSFLALWTQSECCGHDGERRGSVWRWDRCDDRQCQRPTGWEYWKTDRLLQGFSKSSSASWLAETKGRGTGNMLWASWEVKSCVPRVVMCICSILNSADA